MCRLSAFPHELGSQLCSRAMARARLESCCSINERLICFFIAEISRDVCLAVDSGSGSPRDSARPLASLVLQRPSSEDGGSLFEELENSNSERKAAEAQSPPERAKGSLRGAPSPERGGFRDPTSHLRDNLETISPTERCNHESALVCRRSEIFGQDRCVPTRTSPT